MDNRKALLLPKTYYEPTNETEEGQKYNIEIVTYPQIDPSIQRAEFTFYTEHDEPQGSQSKLWINWVVCNGPDVIAEKFDDVVLMGQAIRGYKWDAYNYTIDYTYGDFLDR